MERSLCLSIGLAICSAVGLARESLSELRGRSINVYWTDTPPVLDAKMDDACWKDAEVVRDFRTFQKPTEWTRTSFALRPAATLRWRRR